ncbi:MAG: nucleoside deaminase [Saprospiraceae bacterium]|jgi:tRNA(adenine34) deaminase|nr:nucleoside deaminase [Saprospiraceae bacterium]MBL0292924.1 nucleoside deaminase [Saprospiraceae bacterium]
MSKIVIEDDFFMKQALIQAKEALELGEVPIGAIVVYENQIIAKAYNMVETLNDVTAHAEMLALTSASDYLGGKYLNKCRLYVTLEPCPMCAGAMKWAQIDSLIYGAEDLKSGFARFGKEILHPKTKVALGLFKEESSELLKHFFENLR